MSTQAPRMAVRPRRKPRNRIDFLSSLPDHLIHRILYFLPVRDIVKTCVLSKRWRHVWTGAPNLEYVFRTRPPKRALTSRVYEEMVRGQMIKEASFVDNFLNGYASMKVCRFALTFYDKFEYFRDRDEIERWLRFAVDHCVRRLDLTGLPVELPPVLCSCSSLMFLYIGWCYIDNIMASEINWPCLRRLFISTVSLRDDLIKKILDGSPCLEFLKIDSCCFLSRIQIDSTSMKELVIDSYRFQYLKQKSKSEEDQYSLEIFAPHLKVLRILGSFGPVKPILKQTSSVVEAELDFLVHLPSDRDADELQFDMLTKLRLASNLKIGNLFVPGFLSMKKGIDGGESPVPVFEWRTLALPSQLNSDQLPAIVASLEASPFLEKLVLTIVPSLLGCEKDYILDFSPYSDTGKGSTPSSSTHSSKSIGAMLKTVEIVDFNLRHCHLDCFFTLMKLLLRGASSLEKMTIIAQRSIYVYNALDNYEFSEVLRLLRRYDRASSGANITFKDPSNSFPLLS